LAALVEIGLLLFVITLVVNAVARLLIAAVHAGPDEARA
jgi:ABC-type phosphate transport system permease subunit